MPASALCALEVSEVLHYSTSGAFLRRVEVYRRACAGPIALNFEVRYENLKPNAISKVLKVTKSWPTKCLLIEINKMRITVAVLALSVFAQGAMAAGDGTAAVGGGVGGVLGNIVGQQLGGSTGAAVGAGVGGAAGSALGAPRGSKTEAALGGGLGSAGGSVIGNKLGGTTGSTIGAGLGGAAGGAIGNTLANDGKHNSGGKHHKGKHKNKHHR